MEGLTRYRKISTVTLIVLFLLIGVGGLVRVTGSGMGCPDWPKCFGLWVPPTCECQLPANYHELYKDHGYPEGTNFDPVKTWIEYLNRLLGVLTGLFVMANLFLAYRVRKTDRGIFTGALWCFVVVVLEGALGALVVKLNLQQQSVTLHYLMAVVLVCCLLYSIACLRKLSSTDTEVADRRSRNYLYLSLIATAIQLFSGANLRSITESLVGTSTYAWLRENTLEFNTHRVYAVLLVVVYYLVWKQFRTRSFAGTALLATWIAYVLQLLTGILLNFYDFPKLAQTIHILLPAVLFCSQFYILSFIIIKRETRVVSV